MDHIVTYLKQGIFPSDSKDARTIKLQSAKYWILAEMMILENYIREDISK